MNESLPADITGQRTDAARRILIAARALFAERGYEGVSIRDIAERAKVSKANVFHHFTNKMGLYRAVLEDSSSMFEQVREQLNHGDAPARERLQRFAHEHLQLMLRDPHSVDLFMRQMMSTPDNAQRSLAENNVVDGFRGLIQRLEDMRLRGELADDLDPLVLALVIIGANFTYFRLRGLLDRVCECHREPDAGRFSEALIHLLYPTVAGGTTEKR